MRRHGHGADAPLPAGDGSARVVPCCGMTEPLTSIRNVGPAMAASLERAGIADAGALRALGPEAAYARMLDAGERPHFMAYLALVTGLQGRPFGDPGPAEKARLRARFDAIRAQAAPPPGIEAALDALGVTRPRG